MSELVPHFWFPEAKLGFHPERPKDCDIHPLRGLLRYGPFSDRFAPDPIRIATIAPAKDQEKLFDFIKELRATFEPKERKDYLPAWPGFRTAFKTDIQASSSGCHLKLDPALEDAVGERNPHHAVADTVGRAIAQLDLRRTEFDVVFIYLPARWSAAFVGPSGEDFDLHDHLKALSAMRAIPIQIVRDDRAFTYGDRASVMWRQGLALYTKAGGVPWKLADSDPEAAFIGISYALRSGLSGRSRFVTCCSQVFDADGAGLEFIAYDASEMQVQDDNPFLSRDQMFRVMTRSLDLYARRHSGRVPHKVTVHKSTEFKKEEIEGCMEALHRCGSVDLVQIVKDVSWTAARLEAPKTSRSGQRKGLPAMFPVRRGSLLPLGDYDCLLWLHGDVEGIGSRGSYYQSQRGTPRPVRLVRHAGHGPWDETAASILALSKMNWNNDALYDQLPVTLAYAKVLSQVVKRIDRLGTTPYQFRFFM